MDELSSLSFVDRFSDLSIFFLYGLLFMLAGGAVMSVIDIAERLFLSGNVTKTQYALALILTFFLGLFLQWEGATRELIRLKTQSPTSELQASITARDAQLVEKDRLIQDLKREKDLLVLRNEALTVDAGEKSHRIGQLESAQKDRARRQSIRIHLSKLQDETVEIDKELSISQMGVPPDLIAKITAWEKKALNYISRELGDSEAATFRMAEGTRELPSHVNSFRVEWRDWWYRLWAKKTAIEKLKDQLGR